METKVKDKKYSKLKMVGLYAISFGVNVLPLIVVLIINWEACTKTQREGIAITVAGIFWLLFLASSMLSSLPIKANRVVVLVVLFVMLLLMKPLMEYMAMFSGAAALGAIADVLIVKPIIKQYNEKRVVEKTAGETTKQIKAVMQEMFEEQERKGRV